MNNNYTLYFKYLLFNTNQFFLKTTNYDNGNINVYLYPQHAYYLNIHFKLSSFFYSTQLTDIFCYETPINLNTINNDKTGNNNLTTVPTTVIVYNLHIILPQQRVFLIILNTIKTILTKNVNKTSTLASITELFNNANWLERENTELHGVVFSNKKDTRNLMLQYGDASTPLIKTFPSIGIREIYYDSVTDSLIQTTPTIQF